MNKYQVLAILCKSVDDSHKLVSALQYRMSTAMNHFKSQYLWFNGNCTQKEGNTPKNESLAVDTHVKDGQTSASWWKKRSSKSLPLQPKHQAPAKHERVRNSQLVDDLMVEYEDQTSFYRRPSTPIQIRHSSKLSIGHKRDEATRNSQITLSQSRAMSTAPLTTQNENSDRQKRPQKLDKLANPLPDLPKNWTQLANQDDDSTKVVLRQKKKTRQQNFGEHQTLLTKIY